MFLLYDALKNIHE